MEQWPDIGARLESRFGLIRVYSRPGPMAEQFWICVGKCEYTVLERSIEHKCP